MKKIGMCTCYNHYNYGSMLQSYATQIVIEKLGYKCEMIRYKKKYSISFIIKQIPRLLNNMVQVKMIRKIKKNINKICYPQISKSITTRKNAFKKFQNKHFRKLSEVYHGYDSLCAGSKKYSAIIVGSDQLWLPIGLATNFYNLMFVDDTVPKISYATSFGVQKIPFYQKKRTKTFLDRFDAISVRESRGKEIIKRLTGTEARVVADPTLLLTREDWDEHIPSKPIVPKPYILCYYLGTNPMHRRMAEDLRIKTGLNIVSLKHLDEYVIKDISFGDYELYDISPGDFINLIRYADFVCTDSFHGSVFSILYHKQFKTFYRFKSNGLYSRNSRIDSLFSYLEIEDRIFRENIYKEMQNHIDYDSVEKRLDAWREDSLQFLKSALGRISNDTY